MGSINIVKLAQTIISRYDFNANGVIDLKKPTKGDETTRQETQWSSDAIDYYTWDHSTLFKKADTNADGVVTQDELVNEIKRFDKDGDGELKTRGWIWNPRAEADDYNDEDGEILINHQHIPIGPGPVPPVPVPIHSV